MSDTPTPSPITQKNSGTNKTLIIVVIVLLLLAIGGYASKKVTQKVSEKLGEKTAEKMIENATGGKASVDIDSNSMTVKTDEGTFSTGTDLPSDWPKDAIIYPDSTITYSGSSNPQDGNAGFSVMATTKDSVQKVTDYYTKELIANGWKIETTQNISGTSMLSSTKDNRNFVISTTNSDDLTTITLIVSTEN